MTIGCRCKILSSLKNAKQFILKCNIGTHRLLLTRRLLSCLFFMKLTRQVNPKISRNYYLQFKFRMKNVIIYFRGRTWIKLWLNLNVLPSSNSTKMVQTSTRLYLLLIICIFEHFVECKVQSYDCSQPPPDVVRLLLILSIKKTEWIKWPWKPKIF